MTALKGQVLIQLLLALVMVEAKVDDHGWDYGAQHGPSNWPGVCTKGSKQSPIHVKATATSDIEPFELINYDRTPRACHAKNNGHSIVVSLEPVDLARAPRVTGGGLPGVYRFAQLHFHWGDNGDRGSEHTIDDCDHGSKGKCERSFPMELHLVHFNVKYGDSLGEAVGNAQGAQDALAVLGVFIELDNAKHSYLTPIIDTLEELKDVDSETSCSLFPSMDFLPLNISHFFRYEGSLTTPNCDEIVVWTVFNDRLSLTTTQLERFRSVSVGRLAMENNFRPTQELNGREVVEHFAVDHVISNANNFVMPKLIFFVLLVVNYLLI